MTYYANKLDKSKVVKVRKTSRECRFFPIHIGSLEKAVIVSLRKKSQRQILLLLQRKEHSFSDICNALGLARSTVWVKLEYLVKRDIVSHRYQKGQKMFKLKDPIHQIIKKYQNTIKIRE
jgi:predicted ArsR family transcriptional regulator